MIEKQIELFEKLLNTAEDLQGFLDIAAYQAVQGGNERKTLERFFENTLSMSAWIEDKIDELYAQKHRVEDTFALQLRGDSYE